MKAEELVIGDWVRFPIGNDKIVDLPYVEGKGICASFAASATLFPVPAAELQPIPLTPEILEKNGFKEGERTSLWQNWVWHEKSEKVYDKYVKITLYDEAICGISSLVQIKTCSQIGNGLNELHSCDIQYVHELQHALRLCGIEKEITV